VTALHHLLFWLGFGAGLLFVPVLYVVVRFVCWTAGLPERLFGIWIEFGGHNDESYPQRSYGSIRTVRRIARIVQVGYYRHGWDWESHFAGVAAGKVGIAIGRKRTLPDR
jgi:hypothetical protein